MPDYPPQNLQRQPHHLPARPQKVDGHVFASKNCALHPEPRVPRILSSNYWETFRGCAFIPNHSTQHEWIKGMKLLTMALHCMLLVVPALPLGLDFPVPWRKSCRLCVVWSCPWCWSLAALGPSPPMAQSATGNLWAELPGRAFGITLLWWHQCAGRWGNLFEKIKGLNAKTDTDEL